MLAIALVNDSYRWVTIMTPVSAGGNVGVTVDGIRHTSTITDVRLFCDRCCHAADYIGKEGITLLCRSHATAERIPVRPLTADRVRTLISGRVGTSDAATAARSAVLTRLLQSQRVAVARLTHKAA